jgi:hypothetical protein
MGLPVMALLAELGSQAVRKVGGAIIGRVSQGISGAPPGRYRSLGIMPSTQIADRPGDIEWLPDPIEDILGIGGADPENIPQNGEACFELPISTPGEVTGRMKCPDGYVSVACGEGKICMLKPVARALGKWKSRRKPPISATQWRQFRTATRVEQKLLGIAKDVGIKSPVRKRKSGALIRAKGGKC